MKQDKYKIGIDLGGTKTEAVLLGPDNKKIHRKRIPTPASSGYDAIIKSLYEIITETAFKIPSGHNYILGIGIPGSVNPDTGLVQNANTTCLIGKPLKKDMENLLKREIEVQNDANCFTLAESLSGAATGYGEFYIQGDDKFIRSSLPRTYKVGFYSGKTFSNNRAFP